jgi:hypothetical protein
MKIGKRYKVRAPGLPRVTILIEEMETAGRQAKLFGPIVESEDPLWPVGMHMETPFIYKPGYEGW